jgi:hypothetical protein
MTMHAATINARNGLGSMKNEISDVLYSKAENHPNRVGQENRKRAQKKKHTSTKTAFCVGRLCFAAKAITTVDDRAVMLATHIHIHARPSPLLYTSGSRNRSNQYTDDTEHDNIILPRTLSAQCDIHREPAATILRQKASEIAMSPNGPIAWAR